MSGIARFAEGAWKAHSELPRNTDEEHPQHNLKDEDDDGDGPSEIALGLERC